MADVTETPRATRGRQVLVDTESARGTATGSPRQIRLAAPPQFAPMRSMVEVGAGGHRHPADHEDPIAVQETTDDACVLTLHVRRNADTDDEHSPLGDLLGSGLARAKNTGTTVAVYTDLNTWTLTADDATETGQAGLVELDSGLYWPVLVAAWTAGTKTVEPAMDLPSAASADNAWVPCETFWPCHGQDKSDDSVQIIDRTRMEFQSDTEDYAERVIAANLTAMDDITFEHGVVPTLTLHFHGLRPDDEDNAQAADSFGDGAGLQAWGDDCVVQLAASSSSPGIAHTTIQPTAITFSPGLANKVVRATAGGQGGTQGVIGDCADASIKLRVVADKDYTDAITGSNAEYYVAIIQPTTALSKPAFAIFAPRAQLIAVERIAEDETGYYEQDLTFRLNAADYGANNDPTDPGNAEWVMMISRESA